MELESALSLRKEGSIASVGQLRLALQRWRATGWHSFLSIGELADLAANAGYVDEISPIVDEELERAERHRELWAFPDALRVKGELLLLRANPDPELARENFLRSLQCARAQGALSWELRAATSLARLERAQGRTEQARRLLQSVHGRFTEGFDTADLKRARWLLAELGGASVPQAGVAQRSWPADCG
jgi:predicted ATPase